MMHTISGSGIGHMCLSPDRAGVLAGALDGSISVFDFKLAAGSNAGCATAHVAQVPGPISSLSFAAGGASLTVGTRHGDIFRWAGKNALSFLCIWQVVGPRACSFNMLVFSAAHPLAGSNDPASWHNFPHYTKPWFTSVSHTLWVLFAALQCTARATPRSAVADAEPAGRPQGPVVGHSSSRGHRHRQQ